MMLQATRRQFLVGTGVLAASAAAPAFAQDKPTLRFAAVFSDQDIRAEMVQKFAESVSEHFNVEPHFGGTLFKQGTELVAIQRGNLEMGNIAPQDVTEQIPAWSLLTSGYLFRDADHLNRFFASEAGEEMKQMVVDQLGVRVLGPTFYGTRQIGLNLDKKIQTPADMAGIKLRMPGGDAWQFLGAALGANPTPMAYPEVYTGLQTGAIDGQDNPLPNVYNMKFYEVMKQIVLSSHLVAFDLLCISNDVYSDMAPEVQQAVQAAADEAIAWSASEHLKREEELANFMREQGLEVYEPDVDAFRQHVQAKYLESEMAQSWPEGMLDKINAL
jgi:TRAP-type C4-dicarboxylate transport system substrate-binding protein